MWTLHVGGYGKHTPDEVNETVWKFLAELYGKTGIVLTAKVSHQEAYVYSGKYPSEARGEYGFAVVVTINPFVTGVTADIEASVKRLTTLLLDYTGQAVVPVYATQVVVDKSARE